MDDNTENGLVLVVRKSCFGLPTACPSCLPVYAYLRFADLAFDLKYDLANPDSDDIPLVEYGERVSFNSERGGVIDGLKEDGVIDLDAKLPSCSIPQWMSMKAMVSSWIMDAALYELWLGSDGSCAQQIYFSELPWPIGKVLYWKRIQSIKQFLGITRINAAEREIEIYKKATLAYEALSMSLGDQTFFFENKPTSLDAAFLGHALFVLNVFPDTSTLRSKLLNHNNLVSYAEKLRTEYFDSDFSSSHVPRSPFIPSSSTPRKGRQSSWSSKPKKKPAKREKTEEEKTFRRRSKYFLVTQLVAVILFLSLLGSSGGNSEIDMDEDEVGFSHED